MPSSLRRIPPFLLLLVPLLAGAACSGAVEKDTGEDTGRADSGETSDTSDTGDTSDTDDTADTAETADTSDSEDTSDTGDTGDTGDTSDTGDPVDRPVYAGPLADAPGRYTGEAAGDDAGRLLLAGDLTGDGVDDLLVACMPRDGYSGGAWLLSGPLAASASLADAGWLLAGEPGSGEGAGRTAGLGDVNGDGQLDFAIGAPYATAGGTLILYGPLTGPADLADADVRLYSSDPEAYPGHGTSVGDVSGDGVADALVGAPGADDGAGLVYVAYGPLDAGDHDMATTAAATLTGAAAGDMTAKIVLAADDLDGDGIGDLLVTAPYSSAGAPYGGAVYVVAGPPTGTIALADSDAVLLGANSSAMAGFALQSGDLDGDGLADAVLGSPRSGSSGAVYVAPGPLSGEVSLADAPIVFTGTSTEQQVMDTVAVGDVDGDGAIDVLVGGSADRSSGTATGAAWLHYGPFAGVYDPTAAAAALAGEANGDLAGLGVELGDFDGDGGIELVVGAPGADDPGRGAGVVYVVPPG